MKWWYGVAALMVLSAWPAEAMEIKTTDHGRQVSYVTKDGLVAQPNFLYHALYTPDDPQYGLQWNFTMLNLPNAWDADTVAPAYGGDPSIIVATLDTGLAYEDYQKFKLASDLGATKVWTNPKEVDGDGLDNDGNGYIDDLHGWNFVSNTAHANDDNGHGTHIVSTIAATTNNGLATAGIAFNTTIMPLKVLDEGGNGSTSTIAAAIHYAVTNGADIVNLSLGGSSQDPLLLQEIQAAVAAGVVIVAAAGNEGQSGLNYPARYEEVMAVGAVQFDKTRASYSNYGPTLDVVAPGGNSAIDQNNDGQVDGILQETCAPGDCTKFATYYYSGTSQAAAHVSAVLALLEACGATGAVAEQTLKGTALDLGAVGADEEYGLGLINAAAALSQVGCTAVTPDPPGAVEVHPSKTASRLLTTNGNYTYTKPFFQWSGPAGTVYRVSWGLVGAKAKIKTQTSTSYQPALTQDGSYDFKVQAVSSLGRTSTAKTFRYHFHRSMIAMSTLPPRPVVRLYSSAAKLVDQFSIPGSISIRISAGLLQKKHVPRLVTMNSSAGRLVQTRKVSGQVERAWNTFGSSFAGAISAVVLPHQSKSPIIAVSTLTNSAEIAWYTEAGKKIRQQMLYPTYRGGLHITPADLDGDGTAELIVAQSSGAEVRVYDWSGRKIRTLKPLGSTYRGGWNLTAVDSNGDGLQEILLAPRASKYRSIIIIDGLGVSIRKISLVAGVTFPVSVATSDLNSDGIDEILYVAESGSPTVYQHSLSQKKSKTFLKLPASQIHSLAAY